MRRLLALLAVVAIATSCAPNRDLHVINDLPSDLYSSPSPAPSIQPLTSYEVFFLQGFALAPIRRLAVGEKQALDQAMADLLRGPTPEELGAGISTAVPPGAELLSVTQSGTTATVDLSKEFELSAEQSVLIQRLAQVVYTVTGLPRVSKVSFLIDGEPVSVVVQDGSLRRTAVGRDDYSSLVR